MLTITQPVSMDGLEETLVAFVEAVVTYEKGEATSLHLRGTDSGSLVGRDHRRGGAADGGDGGL